MHNYAMETNAIVDLMKDLEAIWEKVKSLLAWDELKNAGYQIHNMQSGYPLVPTFTELYWKAYLVAKTGQVDE